LLSFPRPRVGTLRSPDRPDTFGDDVAAWHLLINSAYFMPWQCHVCDVAGEFDPATGLRWYDTVLVKVPRQNGKTNLLEAHMLAAARRRDELGNMIRRVVVYTAQDRAHASVRIIKELEQVKLQSNELMRGRYQVRRSNGSEWIEFPDTWSRIAVEASNATAAHGLTVDDAVLDEAFAHRDLTLINAIQPTMITRADPQMWIVSTPGEGDDGLMLHYEELAAIAVNDPDSRLAVFDWSATEDDDREDPDVWRRVMPALGHTITEDRVRSLLRTTPPAEFDRAYLARRPTASTVAALDLAAWRECRNLATTITPAGGIAVAVEVDPDRTFGVIAVACKMPEDRVGVIIDRQPGTRWLSSAVRNLVNRHGVTVVDVWADRRSGLGGVIDELAARGVAVHEVTAGDVASAAGTLFDTVGALELVHDDQPELNSAVIGSRRRPLGDAWTFSKLESVGDVAPAAAVALAVAAYRQHYPRGAVSGGIR